MTRSARIAASPLARRLAKENGLSLAALRGSGPGGRIIAADVRAHGRNEQPPHAGASEAAHIAEGTTGRPAQACYMFDADISALEAISAQLAAPPVSAADTRMTLLMTATARALTTATPGAHALLAYQSADRRRGPVGPAALRGWTNAQLALREAHDMSGRADFTVFDLADTQITNAFAPTGQSCLTIGRTAQDGRAQITISLDPAMTSFEQALALINVLSEMIAAPARLLID